MNSNPPKFGVGASARRKEDPALIQGRGRYVDDFAPANLAHMHIVRSPHAHARFGIRDVAAARGASGVLLVLTAEDLRDLGTLPCLGLVPNADGTPGAQPPYRVLAQDEVRHVGDAVACIVAESPEAAKSAADLVEIDWEPLRLVTDAVAALEPGAPQVWDEAPGNLAYRATLGDEEAANRAFAEAHRTVRLTVVNNRLVTNYMETRGVIAEYDGERWTLTLGSQGSHVLRDILAKHILKVPPERIRVVTPDVGGGFGTKAFIFREYPLAAVAAERLGRPVKWISDRSEHFVADSQGRDNVTTAELALDAESRITGLRVEIIGNLGAYLSQFAPYIPYLGATIATGCYRIPAPFVECKGVFTHTLPVDAYRGAGRPEAAYLIERLMDYAAAELGLARDEFRRLNFVPPDAMPYATGLDRVYDTGEFAGHLDRALELSDWRGFADRRRDSQRRGRLRGISFASYIEACAGGEPEPATIRIEPDGSATILIGTQSTGQGHATAYAQLAADSLGLPLDRIHVRQGDTDEIASGGGTGGSRSIPVGGAAVSIAGRNLAEQLKDLAAEELEAAADDLELVGGAVRVAGTDRVIGFADLAALPQATPDRLQAIGTFRPPEATYPNGTHVCEVEIDPETGDTHVLRYTVVDDFGVTLNPELLAGQVYGGVVQGIGQALLERTVYDEEGQLLTASLQDYCLPRAADVPFFVFETRNVPSTTNALGMKGAGEAGAIGSCPAVINAVVDALRHAVGLTHIDMPATPERVWEALAPLRSRAAAE